MFAFTLQRYYKNCKYASKANIIFKKERYSEYFYASSLVFHKGYEGNPKSGAVYLSKI